MSYLAKKKLNELFEESWPAVTVMTLQNTGQIKVVIAWLYQSSYYSAIQLPTSVKLCHVIVFHKLVYIVFARKGCINAPLEIFDNHSLEQVKVAITQSPITDRCKLHHVIASHKIM